MKNIHVVAAVIHTAEPEFQVFATARGYGPYKGMWEFPGGKIEPGELPEQALKREIREELDANIRVEGLIKTVEYDYPEFHLIMDCYWCELLDGHFVLKEALDAEWLDQSKLYSVRWLPADQMLLPEIEGRLYRMNEQRSCPTDSPK